MGKGSGGGGSQTVVNKTELPEWVQEAGRKNLAASYNVSENMMGPYQGQRVASLTPGTEQVVGNITQNAAMSQPAFAYAQQLAAQAGGYQPTQVQPGQLSQTDLSQYMNPYTQAVLGTSLDVLNQQRLTGLNQAYDAAVKAKAFWWISASYPRRRCKCSGATAGWATGGAVDGAELWAGADGSAG